MYFGSAAASIPRNVLWLWFRLYLVPIRDGMDVGTVVGAQYTFNFPTLTVNTISVQLTASQS